MTEKKALLHPPLRTLLHDAAGGGKIAALFWLLVGAATLCHWITPHLPMTDLPQHAGQIGALRDIIKGQFVWSDLVWLDFVTPYLLGYLATAALALVMPISAAIASILSLTYIGFILAGLRLRRHFGAPALLDFLLIPAFFGATWEWGSYNFLIASPFCLLFITLADSYAQHPGWSRGVKLFAIGVMLLIAHVLALCFGGVIGGALLLARTRSPLALLRSLSPYILLGALLIGYSLLKAAMVSEGTVIQMGSYLIRVIQLIRLPFDGDYQGTLIPVFFTLWAAPFLAGMKLRPLRSAALLPFATFLLLWFFTPATAFGTYFVYQRFILYALPLYCLAFEVNPQASLSTRQVGAALIVALSLLFVAQLAYRLQQFDREDKEFTALLDTLPPQQRLMMLVLDEASPAFEHFRIYGNWPAWYQAEKSGWVDLNYAIYHPQILKYHFWLIPPNPTYSARTPYNWKLQHGRAYRFFVLRGENSLALASHQNILQNGECSITDHGHFGSWILLENTGCTSSQ